LSLPAPSEAVADKIFHAALDPKREVWLGASTLKAILSNMVLPQFLDRYLARNAYQAQETAAAVSPMRQDNLMAPVGELHRTHGSFDAEAANRIVALPGPAARLVAVGFDGADRHCHRLRRPRPVAASAAVAARPLPLKSREEN
jgi:hypothetical protein